MPPGPLTTRVYPTSSLFVSAKALTACSNSLRECAALHLRADARLPVRHDRIEKADHVNAFLEHRGSELL